MLLHVLVPEKMSLNLQWANDREDSSTKVGLSAEVGPLSEYHFTKFKVYFELVASTVISVFGVSQFGLVIEHERSLSVCP